MHLLSHGPFSLVAQHHLINPLRIRNSQYSQACASHTFIIMDSENFLFVKCKLRESLQ